MSPTFIAHGKTWFRHTPGDAAPVQGAIKVDYLMRSELEGGEKYIQEFVDADSLCWEVMPYFSESEIIGWRYAEEKPKGPTAEELIAKIADLERQLKTAKANEGVCHCGVLFSQHGYSDNHSPVEMPYPCPNEELAATANSEAAEAIKEKTQAMMENLQLRDDQRLLNWLEEQNGELCRRWTPEGGHVWEFYCHSKDHNLSQEATARQAIAAAMRKDEVITRTPEDIRERERLSALVAENARIIFAKERASYEAQAKPVAQKPQEEENAE